MASLAHAATGLGQGMLQQRELGRETDRYNQQLGLKEREIGLSERGFEADKSWREETFARGQMEKLKAKKADPRYARKYTIRQQAEDDDQIAELEARFPHVFAQPSYRVPDATRAAEDPNARVAPEPTTGAAPTPYGDLRNPSLFGGARPFETMVSDPLAGGPTGNYVPPPPAQGPPAPAEYQPITDEAVSSLMRETDPQFNMQQNALRPQAPQAQPQQAAAPVAAPRPDGRPQPGMTNRTVIETAMEQGIIKAFREAKDPSLPPDVQNDLEDRAMQKVMEYAKYNQAAAEELFTRIQAGEFPETQEQSRAESRERVTASQVNRNVFEPRRLDLEDEALGIKRAAALAEKMNRQRLDAKERAELELSLRKYGLSVAQFRAEMAVKKQEAVKRGLDINKLMSEPSWQEQFRNEIALKYAYGLTPYGKRFIEGPAAEMLKSAVPELGGPGPGSGEGKVFNRSAFLEGTKGTLTPAQQKQEIEKMRKAGYTIQ